MEIKWMFIAFGAMIIALAAEHSFEQYSKDQCRLAYAQSNRSADEINKICK